MVLWKSVTGLSGTGSSTLALRTALEAADKAAADNGDDFVSTEHLVVGLSGQLPGIPKAKDLIAAFKAVRGGDRKVTSQDPETSYQALEKYGVDLTQAAR